MSRPPAHTPLPMERDDSGGRPRPGFATTHWSMVLKAGRGQDTDAKAALSHLCRTYWYPLYAYARRRGSNATDAQDLTQDFFARLLATRTLGRADPARGRFRTFLLTAFSHFLADEWDRQRAQKRGGARTPVSLDVAAAERRYGLEPVDPQATPDQAFDRHWALTVLATVLERMAADYAGAGKAAHFAALKPTLVGGPASVPYAEIGAQLGLTEAAVKVAVHRLRKRYRELLRSEIAETVTTPEAAEEELRDLFHALGAP